MGVELFSIVSLFLLLLLNLIVGYMYTADGYVYPGVTPLSITIGGVVAVGCLWLASGFKSLGKKGGTISLACFRPALVRQCCG